MSTYWYFECMDHTPRLTSDEFTQHTDDKHYDRAVELVANRPLVTDWDEGIFAETASEIVTSYFAGNANSFLVNHPTCHIGFVNEYNERRSSNGSKETF
jgi:hypothetical protein